MNKPFNSQPLQCGRIFSCRAPLRISFFGGGTDIPSFYQRFGGAVLSTTINKFIYVSVKAHSRLFGEHYRLNYSETEKVSSIAEIKNDIVRECLKFLEIDDPLLISTYADIPASSGLGSSSAFCVALLNSLYQFKGIRPSVARLAEEACHIEIDVLERRIGKQDQYAAAFGGFNLYEFKQNGAVTMSPVQLSEVEMRTLSDSMLLVWTGMQRNAESVLETIDFESKEVVGSLSRMKEIAYFAYENLTKSSQLVNQVCELLKATWTLKSGLSSKVTNEAINRIVSIGLVVEGCGAKLLGAGGGGFVLLVVPGDKKTLLLDHLSGFHVESVQFEPRGIMELMV